MNSRRYSERSLDSSDALWLLSLVIVGGALCSGFLFYTYRFTDGEGGVPLDDAWIHFQFARNLARGDGLSFNPGQPTSGSTAPLWTILLTGAYVVGGKFPVAGQLMSLICFLTTLLATYTLTKQLTGNRWAAWLAGMVVAVNGRMVWAGLSALETCLFAALSVLAAGVYWEDRQQGHYRLRTAALFGLTALSRPEGYLLFILSLADYVVEVDKSTGWRKWPWLPIVVFVAIVSPYLAFSWRTSGHLLPNTYHAKTTVTLWPNRDFLSIAARYLILDNPLLLPFYVLGVAVALGHARLLSLWSVGLPMVYAFLHATLYQHGRYLIPLIPCNAVLSVLGLLEAQRLARRRGRDLLKNLGTLVSLLVILGTAWRLPTMARLYAWNVDNINTMHVAIGQWMAEHTPPDAVLALNDIGAIAYVSERAVVDLAGLVTPEVTPLLHRPDRDARLLELMAQRQVDYVIIFPKWFPGLAARDDVLEQVFQMTLEHNTIVGGATMVVYRAHWPRWDGVSQ